MSRPLCELLNVREGGVVDGKLLEEKGGLVGRHLGLAERIEHATETELALNQWS